MRFPPSCGQNGERLADPLVRTRSDQTHVVIGEGGRFLRIPEVTAEDSGEIPEEQTVDFMWKYD